MNKNQFKLLLISLIWLSSITFISSCQSQFDPDAWEKRHNEYQPPEQVMDSLGVKPGMVIAEVGAGRGRYAVLMAKRVGAAGKIYANDIDKKALDYLEYRCKRDSIANVVTVLGKVTDPQLPKNKMDMVYMINTYHHLDKPIEFSTAKDVLLDQAKQAGFELERIMKFLKRDNIYVLQVKK